jgi:hypothetical protein
MIWISFKIDEMTVTHRTNRAAAAGAVAADIYKFFRVVKFPESGLISSRQRFSACHQIEGSGAAAEEGTGF